VEDYQNYVMYAVTIAVCAVITRCIYGD